MDGTLEEVKKRIDIVDFLGGYIQLKKAGRNFKAVCPFHQEKTPSFVVSPDRQIWHCFGTCGDGGDVIKFLMKWERITFSEALKELAEKVGIKLKRTEFDDKEWSKKSRLIQINTLAAEYFEYILQSTQVGENARNYLTKRGIHLSMAKKFQLGYAPSSWQSLITFMQKKKFGNDELLELGLVIKNDGTRYYDRFRGRIMFPIKDPRGNVIGFSGRLLEGEEGGAKYVNTPETVLYHKRETLYGIHLAKEAIKTMGNAILVEGEFDVISPFQHGVEHIVAIKGSAVTREQLQLLKRYTPKITLALDTDEAGEEAIKRAISEAEVAEIDANVVTFANGKDPDEVVRQDPSGFKKTIEKPVPIYDFLMELAMKKYSSNDAYGKKKISEELAPLLAKIQNPIVASFYVKKLASLLDVTEESVSELIRKTKEKRFTARPYTPRATTITHADRREILQKYLMSQLLQSEDPYEAADKIFSHITPKDFSIPAVQKVAEHFLTFKEEHPQHFEPSAFAATMPSGIRPAYDEIYLFGSAETGFDSTKLDALSLEVKKYSLKKQIAYLLDTPAAEVSRDGELLELTQALKAVEKQMQGV